MEGTERVFAGEFSNATLSVASDDGSGSWYVLTPGGARCNRVFITGALTEVSDTGTVLRCRLADPTGVFSLEVTKEGKSSLAESFSRIAVPSFLAVTGRAQVSKSSAAPSASVRPDSVQIIDRSIRDIWILRTADSTLTRVGALASVLEGGEADAASRAVIGHYRLTRSTLLELVSMVELAIAGIREAPVADTAPAPDARGAIIGIIRELQGKKGVAIEEVIVQAGLRSIPPDRAKEAIDGLIRDDECYQPQKGSLKLL